MRCTGNCLLKRCLAKAKKSYYIINFRAYLQRISRFMLKPMVVKFLQSFISTDDKRLSGISVHNRATRAGTTFATKCQSSNAFLPGFRPFKPETLAWLLSRFFILLGHASKSYEKINFWPTFASTRFETL